MADDTVVFFHAHPDDEAIFTGGTIALLADAGVRVVLVVATSGERGEIVGELAHGQTIGAHRARETESAAAILGVARLEFLGYHDSGLPGDPANDAADSFAAADTEDAAVRLAGVVKAEMPCALVTYDAGGIYGHPDHVQVHRVGALAAPMAGLATVYQATVDREYLHFVETHLVDDAHRASASVMPTLGVPTVYITNELDVRAVVDRKRQAIAAHASQVPETSSAMSLGPEAFAAVYGYEWYVRQGPPGPIDDLPFVAGTAG